ncbi:GNAT family N-acetyltransferase [Candidatus Fermentibacteria bacterium]|nr:GNAT family N-acetyltransferase [Candidatus Fermentibacteria bacterium]
MPSAFGHYRSILWRVGRVLIGRACHYRLGRLLLGAPTAEEPVIDMLSQDSLTSWEDYLQAPRGTLRLPGEGTYCAVAIWHGTIVGHVSIFRQWQRPDVGIPGWWLTGLDVAPRWRGRAVGTRLVRRVVDAWRAREPGADLFMVVHRGNAPAIALHEKLGFRVFHDEEWERRLRRPYPHRRRDGWAYQMMKLAAGDS